MLGGYIMRGKLLLVFFCLTLLLIPTSALSKSVVTLEVEESLSQVLMVIRAYYPL
jgi:hypothetical protein